MPDPATVSGRVSTIIPVHNRPVMLREAVASVLDQSYPDVEVLIVDDGSTDDTPIVINELLARWPDQVRSVRIDNSGPGPAREAGRRMAVGEFIQYLDSDDRLLPGKFDAQVAALRRRPECGIAFGYTRLVDEEGRELASPFKWTGKDIEQLYPLLLVDRWWCTHTPLYRRRLTDTIGPWTSMRWSQDWEYDSRAGAVGTRLVNCHAMVSEHRQHSGQRQTAQADWQHPVRLRNRVQLLQALLDGAMRAGVEASAPERQHFARWAFSIARQCAAAGLPRESRECLDMAELAAGPSGPARRGLRSFRWASKILGARLVGRAAQLISRLAPRPGAATLPQSFARAGGTARERSVPPNG